MLRITLRDGEKVIINGAVLVARGRTEFALENKCTVLRGRDIMQPEEATTPVRDLYFSCQMAYIEPERREDHQDRLLEAMRLILAAPAGPETVQDAVTVSQRVAAGDYYGALMLCRKMITDEDEAAAQAQPELAGAA